MKKKFNLKVYEKMEKTMWTELDAEQQKLLREYPSEKPTHENNALIVDILKNGKITNDQKTMFCGYWKAFEFGTMAEFQEATMLKCIHQSEIFNLIFENIYTDDDWLHTLALHGNPKFLSKIIEDEDCIGEACFKAAPQLMLAILDHWIDGKIENDICKAYLRLFGQTKSYLYSLRNCYPFFSLMSIMNKIGGSEFCFESDNVLSAFVECVRGWFGAPVYKQCTADSTIAEIMEQYYLYELCAIKKFNVYEKRRHALGFARMMRKLDCPEHCIRNNLAELGYDPVIIRIAINQK